MLSKSKCPHPTTPPCNNINEPHIIPDDDHDAPSPRVPNSASLTTIQALLQHNTLPKNMRFQNAPTHSCKLRSNPSPYLIAQHMSNAEPIQHILQHNSTNHMFAASGKKETVDSLINGDNSKVWLRSLSNEWGRLAQGNYHGTKGTDTIEFTHQHEISPEKSVTHASFVCNYCPLKKEACRIRITVGGDRLPYEEYAGAPAANLLETKILINSVISDAAKGARFFSADVKDHFLATPMANPECMKVKFKHLPEDMCKKYHLHQKVTNDECMCARIKKGMPGLKQAALLACDHLKASLEPHGCKPIPGTIGMWNHESRPTIFCSCVDDFGVKYWSKEDADHLCNAIGATHEHAVDREGQHYCGLKIDWNCALGHVDISMPKCVPDALKKLLCTQKISPQHAPHKHNSIHYGQHQQMAFDDTSTLLPTSEIKRIQQIVGSFLCCARALDHALLPAVNEVSTTQAKPTTKTKEAC